MISIVSAYHNRKNLLVNTLKSIESQKENNFEFIVVDDCSDEDHRLEDLINRFSFLKVIRIDKKDKWYVNPCAVFNIGFKEVKGDIVIIQNPECLHVGNILKVANTITDDEYFSFGCYSISKEKTENVTNLLEFGYSPKELLEIIDPQPKSVGFDGDNGWYNHYNIRPVGFHFCSAITTKNLYSLGGFDERFAMGIAYDDNEFLVRIQKKGLPIKIINNPFVVHQWHYSSHNYQHLDTNELIKKNRELYNETLSRPEWSVNNVIIKK